MMCIYMNYIQFIVHCKIDMYLKYIQENPLLTQKGEKWTQKDQKGEGWKIVGNETKLRGWQSLDL